MQLEIAWGELTPIEEVYIYTACPGCLALRLVIPGEGFECDWCWWSKLKPSRVVTRTVNLEDILARLKLLRIEAIVFDGPEPLAAIEPSVACALAERGLIVIARTLGFLDESVYRRFAGCIHLYSLDLAPLVAERKPRGFDRVYKLLGLEDVNLEAVLWYRDRGHRVLASSIVSRYGRPLVVVASEGLGDHAYETVKKLREKRLLVYLHGDSSYTLLDIFCTSCGATLVERRPWGVKRLYEPPEMPSRVRCPNCGSETNLVDRRPYRRPRVTRRVVIL